MADMGNNRVQVLDSNGVFLSYVGVFNQEGEEGREGVGRLTH